MAEITRPWWSRWWAVALWGVASLLAVLPTTIGWALWAWLPVETTSGTDMQGDAATGGWTRVLAAVAAVVVLSLPVLTGRWARKAWLGYLLLGGLLSGLVLVIGMFMFGIL